MRRSHVVSLVTLGSVFALAGYQNKQEELLQQRYLSHDDCARDWGDSGQCTYRPTSGGSGGGYYGPRYYWDRDLGKPVTVDGDGNTRVASQSRLTGPTSGSGESIRAGRFARGGFGGSGRFGSFGG